MLFLSTYFVKLKKDFKRKGSIFTPLLLQLFVIMAKLSREDILKLAQLARLELTEEEITEYSEELSSILQYVEMLQTLDVGDLRPTNQVSGLTNVTREDEEIDYGYAPLDLLKNVPDTEDNLIKVKRMVG